MTDVLARAATAAHRGARALCSPSGVRGAALEVAWIAAHLAMYPLGVAQEMEYREVERYRLDQLPPVQRGLVIGDVEAAGTPILLVHGFVDNRSIFTLLTRGLRRRGFGRICSLNYSVLTGDIRSAARRLATQVERLCEETGYERIHVVGHSLGGVIARYYVQRLGGDSRVHTLVTLGAPHSGTVMAHLLPHRVCRQLRPDSDVMTELAEPAPSCRTRFVAFWSDLDQLIAPKRHATVDHPDLHCENVFVPHVGHMSLPIHHRVVHQISTTLAQLGTDGSTLRSGVSAIGAETSGPSRATGVGGRRSARRTGASAG